MFPSSSILTIKILLMSSGVVSLAVAFKYSVIPVIVQFTVSDLPTACSAFVLLFKPPYLYLLLNGIILVIAVISRFTQTQTELISTHLIPPPSQINIILPPSPVVEELVVPSEVWDVKMAVVVNGLEIGENNNEVEKEEEVVENEKVEKVVDVILPTTGKPLVLTAFDAQKQSKPNREGGSKPRVTKHKRHETLDTTWKMIIEGRETENLENSDTFDNLEKQKMNSSVRENSLFRKSATFKDRTNFLNEQPPRSGIVRTESSLGKEELNSRVEAFINKFNEEMRLQREESFQRYMEMMHRSAH